jgi:tRNA splicing endonuclease
MADPSPTADVDGQEPTDVEGQEPDQENANDPSGQEPPEPKTYSEPYVKTLRREASGYRTRVAELEEKLQEHEDAQKSEHEKLVEKAAAAETRAVEAETRLLRYEVAHEHGLDMAAAGFLTGTTREEIEHRAAELSKLLKERGVKPSAGFDGGARTLVPEKGPPEQEHNEFLLRALGRSPSRDT